MKVIQIKQKGKDTITTPRKNKNKNLYTVVALTKSIHTEICTFKSDCKEPSHFPMWPSLDTICLKIPPNACSDCKECFKDDSLQIFVDPIAIDLGEYILWFHSVC